MVASQDPPSFVSGHQDHTNGHRHDNVGNGNGDSAAVSHEPGTSADIPEPIAIIGIGLRLPGAIHDTKAFWDLLANKGSGRCRVPKSRYNIDAWYGPGKLGHTGTEHGYFLDDVDLATIDASFWSMTKKEIEVMDPQQRLILEVAYEALESSGAVGYKGKDIGCYIGVFGEDWADLQARDDHVQGLYRISGYGDFTISNRVSYELGINGPSMTIRTACSSSLTCLYEACQALYAGSCSSALVGGTNLIVSPHMTVSMTEQGVLSPTATCKSFDAAADGYARAEAINAIHIKKLSDAIRDNDPIRAVIRSACINSDGKTAGMFSPNAKSHEALIRRSHEVAGITDLSKTAMIECHGTGTLVGDPLEASAVANVFGQWGMLIGSVKSNLGHSEGASGITGLVKMVLALENKTIPPNINFKTPSPKIPWKEARLRVPVECEPWPAGKAERVGVNSFGIGGANAHVLLESADSHGVCPPKPIVRPGSEKTENQDPRLLVFSATHSESLRKNIQNIQQYLEEHQDRVDDLSYTLCCRREVFSQRAFAITQPDGSLDVSPIQRGSGRSPAPIFVFTGQGAQYAAMGSDLIRSNAKFAETIEHLDQTLQSVDKSISWTIKGELLKSKDTSRLTGAQFSQTCCTAIQIALVDLLRAMNVRPAAVVGHSSGEIAAAYAAGAISAQDAIVIAYHRGQISATAEKQGTGGMMAVGLGRAQVSEYLSPQVSIGCENSRQSVTLTGDASALDEAAELIRARHPDALVRRLRVNCAYHSFQMEERGAEYLALMNRSGVNNTTSTSSGLTSAFYSSVTGTKLTGSNFSLGPSYWCKNLVSPVLFKDAVSSILQDFPSDGLFLEIGPHSALSGPLRQIAKSIKTNQPMNYLPTLVRGSDSHASLLRTAGQLYLADVPVELSAVVPKGTVLAELPTYAWQHEGQYWYETRQMRGWRMREFPYHDTLGVRIEDGNNLEPTWRNVVRLENIPWVRDHNILGDVLFPGAGYVSIAGEAIRQLTGSRDFSLRNMSIAAAIVLDESPSVTEIITQLRPSRLTTTLNSSWYDFTISSCREGTWTKNCTGQARAGREFDHVPARLPQPGPRHVESPVWYQVMNKFGLSYGPRFQGLRNITASVSDNRATAEIDDYTGPHETPYSLHPCTVDLVFQLFSVAAKQGTPRLFDAVAVPTFIEELYIRPPSSTRTLNVESTTTQREKTGGFSGDATAFCGDEVVLQLKNLRLSQLSDGSDIRGVDPHAGAQLVWKPDPAYADLAQLMTLKDDPADQHPIIEEIALTCMIETHHRIQGLDASSWPPHLAKFADWLRDQRDKAARSAYPNVPNCAEITSMSPAQRVRHIETLAAHPGITFGRSIVEAVSRIFQHDLAILQGRADPLDLLLRDDVLTDLYASGMQCCDYSGLMYLLGHADPNMRVLEIGAGTGSMTSSVLAALHSAGGGGERMFASYTYTDISPGFFVAARERFARHAANIDFRVLDISADPVAQGFAPGSFDLVVASNVLHATPRLRDTLSHVRALLKPGTGRVFLQELAPTTKWINYIMGTLQGWWLGEADGRAQEPYVDAARWDRELKAAGFPGGVQACFHDGHFNSHMVATAGPSGAGAEKGLGRRTAVTVLRRRRVGASQKADALQRYLSEKCGFELDIRSIEDEDIVDPHQKTRPIISLLELDEPFVHGIASDDFGRLQSLLKSLGATTPMLWITRSAQVLCQDPRYSPILGLARTARTELSVDLSTLEIDAFDEAAWDACVRVIHQIGARQESGGGGASHGDLGQPQLNPQTEFVYSRGKLLVGRFYPLNVGEELVDRHQNVPVLKPSDAANGAAAPIRQLRIGKRGFLQTLAWHLRDEEHEPARWHDWVEVETRAAGLNFKDVLISMNIVDGDTLGIECAGVVTRVSPHVKDLVPGDRVMVFGANCFSTTAVTSERLTAKIPDDLGFVDAAALPAVFGTVIHSLVDVARLKKGETVLIHAACGGVGLAAIQLCRMVGVDEIYCTVGSPEKVAYLETKMGVPRSHIFNSRDSTFLPGVLAATGGRGVDVVLNSLSGELLHASWKCVAEFGKMVEIGKRDFIGKANLAMDWFEMNRSFVGVDFGQIALQRPEVVGGLLNRCMTYYRLGHVSPLPTETFPAEDIEQAFRYMQKGTHIGKIVVTMPGAESINTIPLAPTVKTPKFRSDAAHIIIGGLGGLGRSVASWMVMHGARHLVLFSRSAAKAQQEQAGWIHELESQDVKVDLVAGDVTSPDDVDAMFESLVQTNTQVAGVMQASMVLRDESFINMSHADWQAAVGPKVLGTWNLHNALERHGREEGLDYFVLFSSWSGLVGWPGQANYAAGNTFLDSFVQFRHGLGRPCSALNIGLMEDIGYVSRRENMLEHIKSISTHGLKEQDLLDAIWVMVERSLPPQADDAGEGYTYASRSQLCIGLRSTLPLDHPNNRTLWKRDPRMAVYHNLDAHAAGASSGPSGTEKGSNDAALAKLLQEVNTNSAAVLSDPQGLAVAQEVLAREIGKTLFGFMLREVEDMDLDEPLAGSMGVDSLVAIELRNWLKVRVGVDVAVLEILGAGSTLRKLGRVGVERLMVLKGLDISSSSGTNGRNPNGTESADAGRGGGEGERVRERELKSIDERYLTMKAP